MLQAQLHELTEMAGMKLRVRIQASKELYA